MTQSMFSLCSGVLAVAGVALAVTPAPADPPHRHGSRQFRNDHGRFHDELEHRRFHRELDHREAHRYPMTGWQHRQLHNSLDRQEFYDRLEHRDYHRYYAPYRGYSYTPYLYGPSYYAPSPGFGLGLQGRNFSFFYYR